MSTEIFTYRSISVVGVSPESGYSLADYDPQITYKLVAQCSNFLRVGHCSVCCYNATATRATAFAAACWQAGWPDD